MKRFHAALVIAGALSYPRHRMRRTGRTGRCASSAPSQSAAPPTSWRASSPKVFPPASSSSSSSRPAPAPAARSASTRSRPRRPMATTSRSPTSPTWCCSRSASRPCRYHPTRDLITVAFIAGSPVVFSVNAEERRQDAERFRRARPREAADLFVVRRRQLRASGRRTVREEGRTSRSSTCPTRARSQGLADLVGGHIIVRVADGVLDRGAHAKRRARRLRASSGEAHVGLSGRADASRSRATDVVSTTWFALSGPANLPPDIVKKMNREIGRIMTKPEVQSGCSRRRLSNEPMTVANSARSSTTRPGCWKPVVERAGLVGVDNNNPNQKQSVGGNMT